MNPIDEKDRKYFETIRKSVMDNLEPEIRGLISPNQKKPRTGELHRNLVSFSFKKFMKTSPYYRAWPDEIQDGSLSLSIEILSDLCDKGFHKDFMDEMKKRGLIREFQEKGFDIYPNVRMHKREVSYAGINAVKKEFYPYYIDEHEKTIEAGKDFAFMINKTFPIVKDLVESKYIEFKKQENF